MKKLFIAVVLMIVSTAAFSQLFDGTIDGAIPGTISDVSEHFVKKGYKFVNCNGCDSNVLFMDGVFSHSYKKSDVIIHMEKDDEYIHCISINFLNDDKFVSKYKEHVKIFINSFGKPTKESYNKSEWIFFMYTYTIGWVGRNVYHKLKLNKQ